MQPSTGGTFVVKLFHASPSSSAEKMEGGEVEVKEYLLWDRKAEGGFPGSLFCLFLISLFCFLGLGSALCLMHACLYVCMHAWGRNEKEFMEGSGLIRGLS